MGAGLDEMVAGAAEVGQSLFTGNAYMPYGPTQAPIELAEASPPVTSDTQSYEQMLEAIPRRSACRSEGNRDGAIAPGAPAEPFISERGHAQ